MLCLGTMMFGQSTDRGTAERIIDRARDAGVNFIDTADQYARGASEEIVGRAIRSDRNRWILATKVGNRMGEGPNESGLSRRRMMHALDESLARLGTDHVDIYYLHIEDPATALGETLRTMGDLIRSGKVRYFGLSNYRSWRVAEVCRLCDRLGIARPVVSQPYYNAMNRMPEVEHLPACGHYGLGVASYSPVARGVLTGKYDPEAPPPPDSRAGRADARMLESEWRRESLLLARRVREHAAARGITASQFAIAWVLNNRFVTAAIAGPRTLEHWVDSLGAVDFRFGPEDEALIDSMVPTGHPSTPGYSDPSYPLEGRVPRFEHC